MQNSDTLKEFDIIYSLDPQNSFRVDKIKSMFDLDIEKYREQFAGSFSLPEAWRVGLIVGRSGTGKTTIARQLFGLYDDFGFDDKAIIDNMPQSRTLDDIIKTFSLVGFSSPPSWLKSYSVLSQGEKMRVNLAKALLSDKKQIVFDEFTSVVDRDIAKVISMIIRKSVEKEDKQFVAVTCHHDVADWLEPDWIFNTDTMQFYNVKKNDQKLTSQYIEQMWTLGDCLENITI